MPLNKIFLFLLFSIPLSADPFVMGSLKGQLGNQMFIVAATVSLALDHGAVPIFPDFAYKHEDNIFLNYKTLFPHLNTHFPATQRAAYYYIEPHYHYAPIPYIPNLCIVGYFQSEKYFSHHKEEILALFAPSEKITQFLTQKYAPLLQHPCTVSLHLRFYADTGTEQETYTSVRAPYFEKAIAQFPENALFVVFSNQMQRCKKELSHILRNFFFVEGEHYIHDFYLMSLCKHNIICNSSFSWWAAYLNPNPDKKVIAPYPWFKPESGLDFKDVVPEDWILVSWK